MSATEGRGERPAEEMDELSKEPPISNGPNARPRDASIAQSAGGLPDDTSGPVEVDEDEARAIKRKLRGE